MTGIRAFDGNKAHALVETCRQGVFRAQAYTREMRAGVIHESGHQRPADAAVSPGIPHVNAADAAHIRPPGKGVTGKAAYRDQQPLIDIAAEAFPGATEAVGRARPLLHQGFNKVVPLVACLLLQTLDAWDGKLNFADSNHGFLSPYL